MAQQSSRPLDHIVVVGASLAGVRAVETLRRAGFAGRLTLLGDEPSPPYDRPPLSKGILTGVVGVEDIWLRKKQGFAELEVDLRLGQRAVGLAAAEDRLLLRDGGNVAFDGLVIATGARARVPAFPSLSAADPGLHVLRTLADAQRLRAALAEHRGSVIILGAGFIGLEIASVCRSLGLDVVVIEKSPAPLRGKLGAELGDALLALHRERGVDVRLGVQVVDVERVDASLLHVLLSDGTGLRGERLIAGVGVVPNTEWLSGSGVKLEDGVLCDPRCATSRDAVVACGDVARILNGDTGTYERFEHWTRAAESAQVAAKRLVLGEAAPALTATQYFWSDQFDVKVQCAGTIAPGAEFLLMEGSPEEGRLTGLFHTGGRVVAVVTWNNPAALVRYRRAVTEKRTLEELRR